MDNYIKLLDGDINIHDMEYILNNCKFISVDTETTGLSPLKDKLCLIQIYTGSYTYIFKYSKSIRYSNLIQIFNNSNIIKVFHHANFDLRFLMKNLELLEIQNVVCTKIASKLLNGVEEKNSLKYLVKKYFDVDINKSMQTSDWSMESLSKNQLIYAQNDVIYLYKLWMVIEKLLKENELYDIAQSCFDYLPTNAILHNKGIENIFIY